MLSFGQWRVACAINLDWPDGSAWGYAPFAGSAT
jgi:hypothetical protein